MVVQRERERYIMISREAEEMKSIHQELQKVQDPFEAILFLVPARLTSVTIGRSSLALVA